MEAIFLNIIQNKKQEINWTKSNYGIFLTVLVIKKE